jgi:NAD(P)-dependent dehydrogenase (short-subunit alcohol dehydrogenase family)
MSVSLVRRTAVVTGASSGIGRAIAVELARAGADVLIHARKSRDAAEETAAQVRALGREARIMLGDLREAAEHERLVEEAWAWRPIEIWVNNAGADVLTGEAARWPLERKLEELWRVDVTATIRLSRLAGARMKAATVAQASSLSRRSQPGRVEESPTTEPYPTIINIGWDQAEHGMAGDSGEVFAATKGAIMAFTRSLAKSLAPEVRVNCIAPGWIKTAWGQRASADWQKRAVRESLLGRWGTPEDVARVARFLASPDAAFITGQIVPVNGGLPGTAG